MGQQEELDSSVATVLVSEDVEGQLHPRGAVLGLGVAWLVGDEVQILEVAVHRSGRRRGVATRLIRELIQSCWCALVPRRMVELRVSSKHRCPENAS